MILWEIFITFFRIGIFAIGGAYSFLPLIQKEIVEQRAWLAKDEFLEILAMVKIFPGAISIKFATYTGHKLAGFPGIIVANLANLLAPATLIFIAATLYQKYKGQPQLDSAFATIQLVVFAMIIAVAFQSINIPDLIKIKNLLIIIIAFVIFSYTKIHPALIIVAAGFIGAFLK